MKTIQVKQATSPVFHLNRIATERIIINQGGTDSGKTYAIMQLLFAYAMDWDLPRDRTEAIITIVGESIPNLKKGPYRISETLAGMPGVGAYIESWNRSDRTITFITGWKMEFISCETEQAAKNGKRSYLFVNEANGIKNYRIFWQLAKRTRRKAFIDYNPSEPFWAHEKLIGTGKGSNDLHRDVRLIISDHRHNPFLTKEQHDETENIADPDLWKVYARGMTGNLTGLIFPDWTMIPDEDFPNEDCIGGLDFGYTNDPTAGAQVVRIGSSLFVREICYTPDLSAQQTKALFWANGFTEDSPLYCEHDNESIAALQQLLIYATSAKKGPGSIKAGIQRLKQFRVFYTRSSKNLHIERTKYMWAKDKDTGKTTNTPIDQYNHLMDAIRYAVFTHWPYEQHG